LSGSYAAYSASGPVQIQNNAAAGTPETHAHASANDATPAGAPQPPKQYAGPPYPTASRPQTCLKDHPSREEDGRHDGGDGRSSSTTTPVRYAACASSLGSPQHPT